jgi:hypothetical protein
MSNTFASTPFVSLGDDATITHDRTPSSSADLILHFTKGRRPFGPDVLSLYLSTDAATLLRDVLTAALEDAPGTSKPAGAA